MNEWIYQRKKFKIGRRKRLRKEGRHKTNRKIKEI
jgi:hypothetical protein